MQKVKNLVVKTKGEGVYRFDNVSIDVANESILIVYLADNSRVGFPLVNVINFSLSLEV